MFPEKDKELDPGKFYYFRFTALIAISSVVLIGSFFHLIKSMNAGIYTSLDSDLMYVLSMGATFFFAGVCFYKTDSLAELFTFLSDFDKYGKPNDFDKYNKLYDRMSLLHYIYLEILVTAILIYSTYLNINNCEKFNLQYDLDEVCGLFSYTLMPFDIDYFPMKQIFLVIQLFGAHYFYMTAGMLSWFVLETIQHIRIRIRHVNVLFREAVKEKDPEKCREKFNFAVRYHSVIFNLEDKINGAFGTFMFTHMAITGPIIGTGVFALLSGGSFSSFLVCVGWLGGLSFDCFGGQWLQDECFAVGLGLYEADWLHCTEDMKNDIMFVIQRSRTPMFLRATSFGIMDYRMFLAVLKGAYSYVNLLLQTD